MHSIKKGIDEKKSAMAHHAINRDKKNLFIYIVVGAKGMLK
jgi:hypothetical protein